MKIYTKIVISMESGKTLEEQSFHYEGKVALCLAGDALELIGIQNLIDTVIEFMPQSDLLPDIEIDSQKMSSFASADIISIIGQWLPVRMDPTKRIKL